MVLWGGFKETASVKGREMKNDEKMCVYVIKSAMNICKIGISLDPETRLRNLLTAHGLGLEIVHIETVPASRALLIERAAHKMLDKVRSNREWFRVSEEKAIYAIKVASWIVDDCFSSMSAAQAKKIKPKARIYKVNVYSDDEIEFCKTWIEESLGDKKNNNLKSSDIYKAYTDACKCNNINSLSMTKLAIFIRKLGYKKDKKGGYIWYLNIAFRDRTIKMVK